MKFLETKRAAKAAAEEKPKPAEGDDVDPDEPKEPVDAPPEDSQDGGDKEGKDIEVHSDSDLSEFNDVKSADVPLEADSDDDF